MATAATSVCEEHDSPRFFSGYGKITIQHYAGARYANLPFDHLVLTAHVTSLARRSGRQTRDQPGLKTGLLLEGERVWKMITGICRVIDSAASEVTAGGEA
jgi:hypothetical protein